MIAKQRANLMVDVLMLLLLSAVAGTGLLVKYVVLPGREAWEHYGSNRLFLWGLERHEWGTIHLGLGIAFLVLLALHVILHWKTIVVMYGGLNKGRGARRLILCLFILVCALLVLYPFIVKLEVREGGRGYGGRERITGRY